MKDVQLLWSSLELPGTDQQSDSDPEMQPQSFEILIKECKDLQCGDMCATLEKCYADECLRRILVESDMERSLGGKETFERNYWRKERKSPKMLVGDKLQASTPPDNNAFADVLELCTEAQCAIRAPPANTDEPMQPQADIQFDTCGQLRQAGEDPCVQGLLDQQATQKPGATDSVP